MKNKNSLPGLLLLLASGWSAAATIEQVGLADMIPQSALVAHATVVDRWTSQDDTNQNIYTHVVFRIQDVIKGNAPGETLEVRFLGGTYEGLTLSISDQFIPAIGDEGVYFFEDPSRNLVNPLFGWWQGHFPVRYGESGTTKYAYTHSLDPITELVPERAFAGIGVNGAAAAGVRTMPPDDGVQSMPLDEFKARLREIAEGLR